ncbi:protein translocase subunit SecD [Candidatus Fermentibacterales bacterium]|nr:protein translocase subunit SecD [Candidatus Fermentibacterales bacterium]
MKRSPNWRMWSSLAVFVVAVLMIWPTVRWYSLPALERDRAEAAVQPETDNPYLRSLLDGIREEGGEELLQHYRDLYRRSSGVIKLGLDLQGGMYLAYTVIPSAGLETEEALDQAVEIIRNRIDEFGVAEPSITRQGDDRLVVMLPGVRDPARARAIVERQALLEFKLVAYPTEQYPTPASVPVVREIDSRLAELEIEAPLAPGPVEPGLEALPDSSGEEAPDYVMDIPEPVVEVPEPEQTGSFSGLFRFADENLANAMSIFPGDWVVVEGDDLDRLNDLINTPEVAAILESANLELAFGKPHETAEAVYHPVFLVPLDVTRGWGTQTDVRHDSYVVTGANLQDARVRMSDSGTLGTNPYLILEFDSEGSRNWEQLTGENVDQRVTIILDGTVYSVARIRERIAGGGTRLTGGFTLEEARDLRLVLKAGSLPAELEIAEEQTIGPSLGQKSINQGIIAAVVGLVLIGLFMIVYYGMGGLIANLILIFDMLIIMAVLCFPGPFADMGIAGLGARLSLPGIAGIILTIGMAVDASVLIYERIREESRSGKPVKSAVDAGYDRAFITILDSNLTTLITALVLYRFGTGPIRGFAVTLSVGIVASMFCSLVFGRSVMTSIVRGLKLTSVKLGRLAVMRDAHYGIVNRRKMAYLLSSAMILAGLAGFVINGGFSLAIDFTGGVETSVVRQQDMPVEELKDLLEASGLQSVQVQALVDYQGEGSAYVVRTSNSDKAYVDRVLSDAGCSPMEEREEGSSYIRQIGPRVGSELRDKATKAVFMAMIFIVIYIWWRFQFKWGIAAVAALIHDVLVTLGLLAILKIEVSLTIIAALLTIVGYSINDTIVVFDRIREDVRLRKGRSFAETVNISINETLGRTIITSLTTFFAVLMLFLFGGGTISSFALTLLIGIIAGTYSSVFVASPILVDWKDRKKGRGKA